MGLLLAIKAINLLRCKLIRSIMYTDRLTARVNDSKKQLYLLHNLVSNTKVNSLCMIKLGGERRGAPLLYRWYAKSHLPLHSSNSQVCRLAI